MNYFNAVERIENKNFKKIFCSSELMNLTSLYSPQSNSKEDPNFSTEFLASHLRIGYQVTNIVVYTLS